ncbi:MAG: ATP-binding protein [Myxococcaceae bacterium]|nr:ATP-binding protein [Myxococcaceae bacterium]MBH2005955.1 ATP-binding protein [Myxococcaceae bacterium]
MRRLPDTIDDFKKLIEENYLYVDKTRHLYELLTGSPQKFFLSRPRRFGKTLLVSTLEQIFLGNRERFKNLWIDQSDYTWTKHPVLRMSLIEMGLASPEQFEERLVRNLKQKATAAGILLPDGLSSAECLASLVQNLSQKNSVVLLIDEYDAPILAHISNPALAEEMRTILKSFYGVIKALDAHLRFVFITGVTKFNKTSIFSGINNLEDLTLSEQAATLLGIELEELKLYFSEHIQAVAHKHRCSWEKLCLTLQEWYNGYRFSPYSEKKVYNPSSVLKALNRGQFENYWSQTGTPSFLVKLIQEKNYPILDLENLILSSEDLGAFDIEQIQLPTLLFQTGYLTIRDYDPDSALCQLAFPNQEVTQSMIRVLAPMLTRQDSFAPWQQLASRLKRDLLQNNLNDFCSRLRPFFADIPYDLHIPLERYYQTVFYMLIKFMGAEIMTEERTNIGRIDAVLQTPTHTYIVELKMGQSAQEALEQIRQRQYAEKYQLSGKSLIALGLAFDPVTKNIIDQAWQQL